MGIKFIALCIAIGFAFSFIGLVICLVISFLFVKTGLLFIGSFLGILSAIIVNFVILEILFNFIISKTNKKHRIAILLIVSLILAGLGIGLGLIDATKFDYIENPEVINEIEDVYETEMTDNLYISDWYGINEYIETDSSTVKVVVKHSKYYTVKFYNQDEQIDIHYRNEGNYMEMVSDIIKDINNKVIKNYDIPKAIIYASKENIEKLKENEKRMFEIQRIDEIEVLQEQINELEEQIRQYEENEQEKDMIIDSLNEQILENDELVNSMEEN